MTCILLLSICAILQISSGQYYYDKPGIKFQTEEKFGTTSDHVGYDYPKPNIPFEYSMSTREPTTSLYDNFKRHSLLDSFAHGNINSVPKEQFFTSTERILEKQEHGVGYQYLKPKQKLKLPNKVESTNPGYQYQKPHVSFELPSIKPTAAANYIATKNENIFKTNAEYQYPHDRSSFSPNSSQNNGLNDTKGLVTQNVNPGIKSGYQYPKPQSPLLYPQKEIYKVEEGNVYLKPPNPLVTPGLTTSSLSTEKSVHLSTTPRPTNATYKNGEGYIYSKPDNSLILPTPTPLPILKTSKPTSLIPKKSKGYTYEIPTKPLVQTLANSSLATEEPLIVSTTMKPAYPTHKNEQGYNYPKPENPLIITRPTHAPIKITTATEKQDISTTALTTNPSLLSKEEHFSKPNQGYEYPKQSIPFNTNPVIPTKSSYKSYGYNYPKPTISFEPERINEIPRETITGYKYPKPSIPFNI